MSAVPPWGFRVASSRSSGRGHMARCLALADALNDEVVFFIDDEDIWASPLTARGHTWIVEGGTGQADMMLEAFGRGDIGGFLFDGYQFPIEVIRTAAHLSFCVEVCDHSHPSPAQVIFAPFLREATADGEHLPVMISGAAYALLDEKFEKARTVRAMQEVAPVARKILVSFGAFDSANLSGQVLRDLRPILDQVEVVVAIGKDAPHLDHLRELAREYPNVQLHVDADNMPELYQHCDIAIGAGGTSMLEMMAVGVPAVIVTSSEQQSDPVRVAEDAHAIVLLGNRDCLPSGGLLKAISELVGDAGARRALRQNAMNLIDGQGAKRAAAELQRLRSDFERTTKH